MRKEEKLSAQINRKMELVPALPGDWEKWVEKVGADKNYIFMIQGKMYEQDTVLIVREKYLL